MNNLNTYPYYEIFTRPLSDLSELNEAYQVKRRRRDAIRLAYGDTLDRIETIRERIHVAYNAYVSFTEVPGYDYDESQRLAEICRDAQYDLGAMSRLYGSVYEDYQTLNKELEELQEQQNLFKSHYC